MWILFSTALWAAPTDGVYVLRETALELREDTFRTADGHTGHLETAEGRLRLKYQGNTILNATYAVIDEHLWLGVLRHEGALWNSELMSHYPGFRGDRQASLESLAPLAEDARYQRHGEIAIWGGSRDLGPVGEFPNLEVSIVGEWIDKNSGETYTMSPDGTPEVARLKAAWACGVQDIDGWDSQIHNLNSAPDPLGVRWTTYGWNCCAGHMDVPGKLAYYARSESELVLNHERTNHYGPGERTRVVLQRTAAP